MVSALAAGADHPVATAADVAGAAEALSAVTTAAYLVSHLFVPVASFFSFDKAEKRIHTRCHCSAGN